MKSKTKILHVLTSLGDGGLEKVVYLIISGTSEEKFEHHLAVLLKNRYTFLKDDLISKNVKIVNLNFDNRFNSLFSFIKNFFQSIKLANYINMNNIEVVHSHDFFPAFSARISVVFAFVFKLYKVKKVFITLHNSFFWLNPFHHFINKALSSITTKIICVSESVKAYSVSHDKINSNIYTIIYNGVDNGLYIPDQKYNTKYKTEFGIKPDDIVIGNVGVLSIRKGQKYLVEAFNELLIKRKNLKLLIFGSEREHEKDIAEELYNLIDKNNLKENVKIIQPRKDLNLIYNIFDIYVMPSITEGLSLSAMEAMLMEKICLFSDIPPFKEMIKENQNGFLFKSEDVNDLIIKLDYILNNLDSLIYIGENARKEALIKYDVKNMVREYEKLYLN